MRGIIRIACALVLGALLAGCSTTQVSKFQTGLTNFNAKVDQYAPVVGKDLLMVANILIQAECSPALSSASAVATNILTITAPNSSSAQTVQNVLATNAAVAAQLCPLVSAIRAQVGAVPKGLPSQVISATP